VSASTSPHYKNLVLLFYKALIEAFANLIRASDYYLLKALGEKLNPLTTLSLSNVLAT